MTPLVQICNKDKYSIVITDVTQKTDEYIPEDVTETSVFYGKNKYKYSDTSTINIIEKITSSTKEIVATLFTDHSSFLDEVYYEFEKDGYYVIHHFILPNLDWLDSNINNEENEYAEGTYICDCNKIYKLFNNKITEVSPEVLIRINTEGTNISKAVIDQFSIYFLYNCYINLCQQIFNNINFRCRENSNIDSLIFDRDFIWMTINIIKYHVQSNQYLEAQRLLEEVNYCGGLCNDNGLPKQSSSGCGCNK